MKYALVGLLLAHGALHLFGFAKGFGIAEIDALQQAVSRPLGSLWFVAAVLLLASGSLLAVGSRDWVIPATPALVLSQILIFTSWNDWMLGTLPNLVILAPLALALFHERDDVTETSARRDRSRLAPIPQARAVSSDAN